MAVSYTHLDVYKRQISAYSLIIEKGTPFYEKYKFEAVLREAGKPTEHLPSEETEYEIYKKTQEILAEAGYEPVSYTHLKITVK